jgi:ComF family protein
LDKIAERLFDLLTTRWFGSACVNCRVNRSRWRSPSLCRACLARIVPCPEMTLPLSEEIGFFHAAGLFEGPLRNILLAFKYRRKRGAAPFLADLFLGSCRYTLKEVDGVACVPMSFWGVFSRGYNPSELVAREVGKLLGKPVITRALNRGWGPSQTRLNRPARFANAARVFRLSRSARLEGFRTVLLIDDVCTTGATLAVCAGLLKRAGVSRVWAGSIARQMRGSPPRHLSRAGRGRDG